MIVPGEQWSLMVANNLFVACQKRGRPLGSKNTIFRERKIKNKDSSENNARIMNISTLLESLVLDKLIVQVDTYVQPET